MGAVGENGLHDPAPFDRNRRRRHSFRSSWRRRACPPTARSSGPDGVASVASDRTHNGCFGDDAAHRRASQLQHSVGSFPPLGNQSVVTIAAPPVDAPESRGVPRHVRIRTDDGWTEAGCRICLRSLGHVGTASVFRVRDGGRSKLRLSRLHCSWHSSLSARSRLPCTKRRLVR